MRAPDEFRRRWLEGSSDLGGALGFGGRVAGQEVQSPGGPIPARASVWATPSLLV